MRYLENRCTSSEIRRLLDYFNLEEENKMLTELVHLELQRPAQEDFENNPAVQAMFVRVQENFRNRMEADSVPVMEFQSKNRLPLFWLSVAASVLLILTIGLLNQEVLLNWINPVKMQQLVTVNGERKQIKLGDGTMIWLNPRSILTYPDKFRGDTRKVSLTGEAFFEVAKDKKHPFIVHSDKVNTRVLGTSFDITSYKDQPEVDITLLTGKVAVRLDGAAGSGPAAEMIPNQRITYNKSTGSLTKQDFPDAAVFLARREGKLIYKGTALSHVISDLQLFYNIHITLPGTMSDCLFYGTVNTADDPQLALQQISLSFNAAFNKAGQRTYTISKGDCSK